MGQPHDVYGATATVVARCRHPESRPGPMPPSRPCGCRPARLSGWPATIRPCPRDSSRRCGRQGHAMPDLVRTATDVGQLAALQRQRPVAQRHRRWASPILVMNRPASLAKRRSAPATSLGVGMRPNGMPVPNRSTRCVRSAGGAAGGADDDVGRAESVDAGPNRRLDIGAPGHIAMLRLCIGPQFSGHLVRLHQAGVGNARARSATNSRAMPSPKPPARQWRLRSCHRAVS